jgi:hypothetical protein
MGKRRFCFLWKHFALCSVQYISFDWSIFVKLNSPFSYIEAKFYPSWKRIKNSWRQSRWNFSEVVHTFWPQREWRNFGRVESRTSWRETKKINTIWLRHITRMNNKRMPKKCCWYIDQMDEDDFKRPSKSLLDKSETGLFKSNSWRMMMMFKLNADWSWWIIIIKLNAVWNGIWRSLVRVFAHKYFIGFIVSAYRLACFRWYNWPTSWA